MLTYVRVSRVNPGGVRCTMDNDLPAWIPNYMISEELRARRHQYEEQYEDTEESREEIREEIDKQMFALTTQVITPGQAIQCRIKSVDKNRFSVRVSCLESDVADPKGLYMADRHQANKYLLEDDKDWTESSQIKKILARKERPFIPRRIDFPLFKNLSKDDAEKHLEKKREGDCLIRPSSKGLKYLSLTWKMANDPHIFVHFSIKENNKISGPDGVGQELEIEGMKYEDLDEVV